MIGGTKAIRTLIIAASVIAALTLPAYTQGLANRKSGGSSTPPPAEKHPPVDEKAYKAALDRIPVPDKKYDPWCVARPSQSEKAGKKSS